MLYPGYRPEPVFDDLTRFAASVCKTPIALVSLVDSERQWFKSVFGLSVRETHRDLAFCAHAILGTAPFIIKDAAIDPRTCDNLLVTGAPHIRFYAGIPLCASDGHALGTLCVIDTVPRDLSLEQLTDLESLARQASGQIELRRANYQLAEEKRSLTVTHDRLVQIAAQVPGVVYQYLLRPDGSSCFPYASEGIRQIYRVAPEEVRYDATKVLDTLHPDDHDDVIASIEHSARTLQPWRHEYRVRFENGETRWLCGNAMPTRLPDRSVCWHGFITDITQQRVERDESYRLRAQLEAIVDASTQVAIITTDLRGVITLFNTGAEQMLGYAAKELIGLQTPALFHLESEVVLRGEQLSRESRFGIPVAAAESFCLRSVSDVVRFVERHQGVAAVEKREPEVTLPRDPELLPLWDHERATQTLARGADRLPQPNGTELRVVIAATFTAETVASSLQLWARAFGLNIKVEFAGFNQVVQELLSRDSLFRGNRTGLNVVLTRPEDLLGEDHACSAEALLDAIAAFSREANGTLVVGTLPPVVSKVVRVDRDQADTVRANWRRKLAELSDVTLLDFAGTVEDVGVSAAGHSENEIIARSPYSAAVYRELGIQLARLVRQRRVAPAKVVALDADGVLWGGVIAEEGMDGIHLGTDHPGRSFRLFQQYLKSLQAQGQLLVLVSRNQPEDVWKVVDQHPGMVLRRDDFAAARINWLPKSQNLKDIAKELNLGLDAFVFIDDDVANRLEMTVNAPGVTVVPLPVDAAQYVPMISRLWRFDAPQLTAEDQARAVMMQQEQERKRLQENTGDLQSYLQSLSLRVVMRPANDIDLPRVAQLTQKTNQFNLSLKRRSLSEIRDLGDRFSIHVIEASDRFGDYGLVGVTILERPEHDGAAHQLDTLLMSCRVLGRGVEEATLHGLTTIILAEGGSRLAGPVVIGPRNQPILEFLSKSGFETQGEQPQMLKVAACFPLPEHIDWNETVTIALPGRRSESFAA